ncbi:hypothetical protein C1646_763079 [Rhizophagus diaphanus]|nr:hypothetical protein C1646_763079 [Rhizophagus diaphanus] [Rhizophagus sp. MUCL 43196]
MTSSSGCEKSADININVIMTSCKNSNKSFSISIDNEYNNLLSSPAGRYYFTLQSSKYVTEKEKSYIILEEFNYKKFVTLDELSDYF